MTTVPAPEALLSKLNEEGLKMGELKKIAKEIKRDHELAMALWSTKQVHPRLLAVLIMDKKRITQDLIDQWAEDLQVHAPEERNRIADWLLANQLMKSKKTVALLESWENASSPTLRRLFWTHQGRQRWTGQTPPPNTAELLSSLETGLATADPDVQWAMNFTAGWIGVYQAEYRERCINLGERVGLYKDDPVPPNCTPNYLPEFIRIEAAKRES